MAKNYRLSTFNSFAMSYEILTQQLVYKFEHVCGRKMKPKMDCSSHWSECQTRLASVGTGSGCSPNTRPVSMDYGLQKSLESKGRIPTPTPFTETLRPQNSQCGSPQIPSAGQGRCHWDLYNQRCRRSGPVLPLIEINPSLSLNCYSAEKPLNKTQVGTMLTVNIC